MPSHKMDKFRAAAIFATLASPVIPGFLKPKPSRVSSDEEDIVEMEEEQRILKSESNEMVDSTIPQDPNIKLILNEIKGIKRDVLDIKDNMISKSDLKYLHRFVQNPRGAIIPMSEIAEVIFSDPSEGRFVKVKDLINTKVPVSAFRYLTENIADEDV